MKELWFGAWQNFYDLNWPIRFFIELAIVLLLAAAIIKLIRLTPIPKGLTILFVFLAKECIYLVGRKKDWAVEADNKITDWGKDAIGNIVKKRTKKSKKKTLIFFVLAVFYIGAVFVDLPFSKYFQGDSLDIFYNVKDFFWQIEGNLSKGYTEYSPLLKKQDPVFIQLNQTGKKGSKIRREPYVDGKIIGKADGNTTIYYKNKLENDGKWYWLKVFLPDERMEGWLNGKLINQKQLKKLVEESKNESS